MTRATKKTTLTKTDRIVSPQAVLPLLSVSSTYPQVYQQRLSPVSRADPNTRSAADRILEFVRSTGGAIGVFGQASDSDPDNDDSGLDPLLRGDEGP